VSITHEQVHALYPLTSPNSLCSTDDDPQPQPAAAATAAPQGRPGLAKRSITTQGRFDDGQSYAPLGSPNTVQANHYNQVQQSAQLQQSNQHNQHSQSNQLSQQQQQQQQQQGSSRPMHQRTDSETVVRGSFGRAKSSTSLDTLGTGANNARASPTARPGTATGMSGSNSASGAGFGMGSGRSAHRRAPTSPDVIQDGYGPDPGDYHEGDVGNGGHAGNGMGGNMGNMNNGGAYKPRVQTQHLPQSSSGAPPASAPAMQHAASFSMSSLPSQQQQQQQHAMMQMQQSAMPATRSIVVRFFPIHPF
jgi:hypothetical protein